MRRILLPALVLAALTTAGAAAPASPEAPKTAPYRWTLDQGRLTWKVATPAGTPRPGQLPHIDRVEMSGKRAAAWVTYGADAQGQVVVEHACVFPTLRVAPNDTHASLMVRFRSDRAPEWMNRKNLALPVPEGAALAPVVQVGGRPAAPARLLGASFQEGLLVLRTAVAPGLTLERTILPSTEGTAILEQWVLRNEGSKPLPVAIPALSTEAKLPFDYVDKGLFHEGKPLPEPRRCQGTYTLAIATAGLPSASLAPGASTHCLVAYQAWDAAGPRPTFDIQKEVAARKALFVGCRDNLRLECPDPVISSLLDFSKFRACESIIATQHGPMHAPGGCSYYAALWANDSVEYVAPFYPYVGHAFGLEANRSTFDHFARYLNPDFRPLPSSIIAEGTDIWAGAGDRGDQAMIAYGVATTMLATGNPEEARRHWPLVTWCLDYLARKVTPEGVIQSDADELEGRFSHGRTNLNTSVLTYGGLRAAANLAVALGEPERAEAYHERAGRLAEAIERYFGREVRGFRTYRYHEDLEELRAWICMPLTMGLLDRKEGTLAALFSPRLWTADGLLTAEGSTTFWDRSSLYALRGVFQAGSPDLALKHLQALSRRRLLGEHVPYVVEAFPEGNGRHLSAESALYARIITEGLFGLEPTGFGRLTVKPSLPTSWPRMALRDIRLFGSRFSLAVRRVKPGSLQLTLEVPGKPARRWRLKEGQAQDLAL